MSTDSGKDEIFREDADKFTICPKYIMYDPRLKARHKEMWWYLSMYAFQKRSCFPGIDRISRELDIVPRTVIRTLDELIGFSLIEKQRRPNKTNLYTIKRVEQVYVESLYPWKLKDWFLKSLIERKIVEVDKVVEQVFQDADNGEVVPVLNEGERERVEAKLRAQRSDRLGKMTQGLGDMRERAAIAVENAKRNRELKTKRSSRRKGEEGLVEKEALVEKPLNTNDVKVVWMETANKVFGPHTSVTAPWRGEEYGIVKRMIAEHGADVVIRGIVYVLESWEKIKAGYGINDFPNMKLIAHNAKVWFPDYRGEEKVFLTPREKALKQGEYEHDPSDTGPTRTYL